MQGLYPIIRRQRVPLVVTDAPPFVVGNVEPVPVVAAVPELLPAAPALAVSEVTQAEPRKPKRRAT